MTDDYHDRLNCPICKDRNVASIREIGLKLGFTRGKVQKHLQKWCGKPRTEPKRNGKELYWEGRLKGLTVHQAAHYASVSPQYAENLEGMLRASRIERTGDVSDVAIEPERDDRHVRALIAAGGYGRWSEKPARNGQAICCGPFIPFSERAA